MGSSSFPSYKRVVKRLAPWQTAIMVADLLVILETGHSAGETNLLHNLEVSKSLKKSPLLLNTFIFTSTFWSNKFQGKNSCFSWAIATVSNCLIEKIYLRNCHQLSFFQFSINERHSSRTSALCRAPTLFIRSALQQRQQQPELTDPRQCCKGLECHRHHRTMC